MMDNIATQLSNVPGVTGVEQIMPAVCWKCNHKNNTRYKWCWQPNSSDKFVYFMCGDCVIQWIDSLSPKYTREALEKALLDHGSIGQTKLDQLKKMAADQGLNWEEDWDLVAYGAKIEQRTNK